MALALGGVSLAQTANISSGQFGAGPRVRITQAVDNTKLVTLHGSVNPHARAQFDQGAMPGSQAMNRITLLLQRSPQQETTLEQLMAQQLDKSSPNYHKWLTPAEFGAQFGPADADIQAIKDWLTAQGFTNIRVSAGKTVVQFDGNVGLVQGAFHTPIHGYFVNGKNHFANVDDPQIPAALSPVV
ncbi:MAG TPA: protease pro-enzyme activation domain-containing protein, partial [Candidatus Acidoferrum sp.]|nr:protease pro-enzyme activation domain-containing protein [Candidatus Acidoferrum sp.]